MIDLLYKISTIKKIQNGSKIMTHIRIADFCAKYGYTKDQIRHATRTGKLDKVAKGIVDEQHAIQAMSYTKPWGCPDCNCFKAASKSKLFTMMCHFLFDSVY
ncbi:hypothetical protein [Acinetobacter indicus]|uniref:hypothetical protein n=1 Tax=Acinetobacter indicus TaxID=756892 RepID=UPI001D0D943F|nr:hypothetical protein [Acinetobacter indicus]